MRRALVMIGVPVVIFALGCGVVLALSTSPRAEEPRAPAVSLIQLIANPAAFDGKRVTVTGYLTLEFENTALYLHESDARYGITRNGLWLDLSLGGESHRVQFHQQYALIEGTFSAGRGHRELFSGSIDRIGRFELVEPRPGPLRLPPH